MFSLLAISAEATVFPSQASNASCPAEFLSIPHSVYGPKFSCINSSVLDFWNFEAISTDGLANVVINFYLSTNEAFPFFDNPNDLVTTVGIDATYSNGTLASFQIPASQATVTANGGQFVGGDFDAAGATWSASEKDGVTSFIIDINAETAVGIEGSVVLTRTAPPHYPCSADVGSGQTEHLAPHVGWSNIVPAANSTVNLNILGSTLSFDGIGYSDKFWTDVPFLESFRSYYWGHTTLGNYSVVWFDMLDINGTEHVSSYASRNGDILVSSCTPGSVIARPTGQNDLYPPTATSGLPTSFNVSMDLGEEGFLELNIEGSLVNSGLEFYGRGLGHSWGTLNGVTLPNGTAFWDMFALVDLTL